MRSVGRRTFLRNAGIGAAAAFAAPFIRPARAETRSLKISTFGGNFENGFKKFIYPAFEKATGIRVESVSQPADLSFLMQIIEANRIGTSLVDLCTTAQLEVRRGGQAGAWRSFDLSRIPNTKFLTDRYIHKGAAGVDAIGAMGWYGTLVVNPDEVKPLPTSWSVLWDPAHRNAWGLVSGANSSLYEITATLYFGGLGILDTQDGILQVLGKIAELKPNVKVWWTSEGTMQTAYENDEVIGGMYFHDVAGVMAKSGVPIVSIFPKEGGLLDFGSWCQPIGSTKTAEAEEFINFTCLPATQAMMVRDMGVSPVVDRKLTDLTDAEFAAASSDIPPISQAVDARLEHLEFMEQQFTKMLTS